MTTIHQECIILLMENLPRIIEVLLSWPIVLSLAVIFVIKIFKDDVKTLFRHIAHPEAGREKTKKSPVTDSTSVHKLAGVECIKVKHVKNLGAVYSVQDCSDKSKDTE